MISVYTSTLADGNMSDRFDVSEVVDVRRDAFLRACMLDLRTVALLTVAHTDQVVILDHTVAHTWHGGWHPVRGEAVMTSEEHIVLALQTADCLPVVFRDVKHHTRALLHVGWRPATLGLLEKTLTVMTETYGTRPQDLQVHIGPGISVDSYAHDSVAQTSPQWDMFIHKRNNQYHIDLKGFSVHTLIAHGVLLKNIYVADVDTGNSPSYFSHYRSMRTGEPEGRTITLVS
jgi:polyphenol oxidase